MTPPAKVLGESICFPLISGVPVCESNAHACSSNGVKFLNSSPRKRFYKDVYEDALWTFNDFFPRNVTFLSKSAIALSTRNMFIDINEFVAGKDTEKRTEKRFRIDPGSLQCL